MGQVVSSLLPQNEETCWVLLDVHESTDGIFEHIAELAGGLGFSRDAEKRNVYHRGGVSYVGYWSSLDSLEQAIGVRERGYYGGEPEAQAMRDALSALV